MMAGLGGVLVVRGGRPLGGLYWGQGQGCGGVWEAQQLDEVGARGGHVVGWVRHEGQPCAGPIDASRL